MSNLTALTTKFLANFVAACPEEQEGYTLEYILPKILAECMPHNLDTEFYHPFIGMGFVAEIIDNFWVKYSQKIPQKIKLIVDKYPREYKDERYRLQNWIEGTVEVPKAKSKIINGQYKFIGFVNTAVPTVSFTYLAVNSGYQVQIECIYDTHNQISKVNFYSEKNDRIISLDNSGGKVTSTVISNLQHVGVLNSTLLSLNAIAQDLERNVKINDDKYKRR